MTTRPTVTVVGYGSQGRAQALNLKDSGWDVRVATRPGRSERAARADGLRTVPLERAAETDVVQILLPDLAQPAFYEEHLAGRLAGRTLMFSHGFCVHHGAIVLEPGVDVVMVAPKAPGKLVRDVYTEGRGVPCLIAVAQDASGRARATALAYAEALGAAHAGILDTTFAEETETDLFGEQAVLCGGMTELVVAGFETLVEAGYQPEVAYFECLHELKLIVDLVHEGGLKRMHEFVSATARYGDLTRGPRVVDARAREEMRRILAEIRSGEFGREWMAEVASGQQRFAALERRDLEHPIERVGAALRSRMTRPGGAGSVRAEAVQAAR